MKTLIMGAAALATVALTAGAAMAQPYGYRYGYDSRYDRGRAYDYRARRDSDRDGIPDRREWNRDRDRDGRPDQFDRYDNRRNYRYGYGYRYGRQPYYDRYYYGRRR